MKISEYIQHLERILSEHGDLEVETSDFFGRVSAPIPSAQHRMILMGRETKPRFACSLDPEYRKGERVCRV